MHFPFRLQNVSARMNWTCWMNQDLERNYLCWMLIIRFLITAVLVSIAIYNLIPSFCPLLFPLQQSSCKKKIRHRWVVGAESRKKHSECRYESGNKQNTSHIYLTIFYRRPVAENGNELMRPYLHEFLTSAYEVSFINSLSI